MPIKPENLARYPRNWPTISGEVRERAGWRCEWPGCRAVQYAVGYWLRRDGEWAWVPCQNDELLDAAGQGLRYPELTRWTYAEAREFAASLYWDKSQEGEKPVVIVLTVAHLDHTPENCALDNLRAWCQRHHLAYDAENHRASSWATRRAKSGTDELFPLGD